MSMWLGLLEGGETREELGYKCALFSPVVQRVPHLTEGYCLHPERTFLPQLNFYGKTTQICPEVPLLGNSKPSHTDTKWDQRGWEPHLSEVLENTLHVSFPNFITLHTDLPYHPAIPLLELMHLKQTFGDTNASITIY